VYTKQIAHLFDHEDWQGVNQLVRNECKRGIGFGLVITEDLRNSIKAHFISDAQITKMLDPELERMLDIVVVYKNYWESVFAQTDYEEYMRIQ
jgi:hypothetical protein